MANFMAEKLGVKSVYILDDSGAYGVGLADAYQAQAEKKGIKVLGRDRLDPKAADYTAILTKIKSLNPQALYYGGVGQAGIKLAKQAYDIIPTVIKAGGDGVYGATFLTGAGFPACEGWYATIASPHLTGGDEKAQEFVKTFTGRFGVAPEDYSITAYDAALVIIDAVKRVAAHGQAGDPRCGARCDPDRQGAHHPGHRVVRRQRRPCRPHGERVPDQAGQGRQAGRRFRPIPLHRRGAAGVMPIPSWPGPTRPSTHDRTGADGRVRPGHDVGGRLAMTLEAALAMTWEVVPAMTGEAVPPVSRRHGLRDDADRSAAAADDQRLEPGCDVRLARARVHPGLRHPGTHQLLAFQRVHGRLLHRRLGAASVWADRSGRDPDRIAAGHVLLSRSPSP